MTGSRQHQVILQPRDRHLLSELPVLRVVDREQARLFAPFGSVTRTNARLLALTRAGYLDRAFVGTITGGRKAIYFLPGTKRRGNRNPLAREESVVHQLALNLLYHHFKYQVIPGAFFIEWRRFDLPLSAQIPLIPDGYVRLRTPAGEVSCFVEMDRGTEPLRVWERKISWYLELAVSGEYERSFGDTRFRVLVVTEGARRLENIRKAIAARTERIFWLTTLSAIVGESLSTPIWSRPTGVAKVPLV